MNSYERIMTVLRHETPDCVPVAPFLSNHAAKIFKVPLSKYYTDGKLMGETLYKAWELYGYDMIFTHSDGYYIAEGMGTVTKMEGDELPVILKHPISSMKEGSLLKVPDPYTDGRMPVYLEALDYLSGKLKGKVALRGTGTGMFALASHLYGLQDFLMKIAEIDMAHELDEEELFEEERYFKDLMEICTETLVRFATAEIEAGADIVHLGDSLASLDVVSPRINRKYILPYLTEFFSRMQPVFKKHNAYGLLHICGNNTILLDDYAKTGADIFEVDYKVDLSHCKKEIGDKMVLLGNINPVSLLELSEAEVRQISEDALAAGAPGGDFMLGTGCETPVNSPIKNIQAMVDTGHSYRY